MNGVLHHFACQLYPSQTLIPLNIALAFSISRLLDLIPKALRPVQERVHEICALFWQVQGPDVLCPLFWWGGP